MHWDTMRREQWRDLQDRKLAHYLRHEIIPYHPYAQKFKNILQRITSVEKLQRYPELITQKRDIVGQERDFVLQPDMKSMLRHDPLRVAATLVAAHGRLSQAKYLLEMQYRDVQYIMTTGRSSAKTGFVFTNYDLRGFLATAARRAFEMLNVPPGSRGVSVFPATLHLAHVFVVEGAKSIPSPVIPLVDEPVKSTQERILAIERLKPVVLFGVSSYLDRLLALAHDQGRDFSSVLRVVVGGESLSGQQRKNMRASLILMGSPDPVIVSSYGFTETRMAFIECVEGAREGMDVGYHLFPDLAIIETARIKQDEWGNILTAMPCEPLEKGDILATQIEGHGTWVPRWWTKDQACISEQPCPACGRRMPRILGPIKRRSSDMEKNVKATRIDFAEIEILFDRDPDVRKWQIEIETRHGSDFLTAYVVFRDGADVGNVSARLGQAFKAETEVSLDQVLPQSYEGIIQRLGTDTELKEQRIKDLRKEA